MSAEITTLRSQRNQALDDVAQAAGIISQLRDDLEKAKLTIAQQQEMIVRLRREMPPAILSEMEGRN